MSGKHFRDFRKIWDQLQGKKPHMPHFLSAIRLQGIRGINDLNIRLEYPVSVIAGGNASGKSTVLFAAACAYKVPGAGTKTYVPSTLFPRYNPKQGTRHDEDREITLEYTYSTKNGVLSMLWRCTKRWKRTFGGRRNVKQPERDLYLRTLSNLSNPSEVRSILQMSYLNKFPTEEHLTPAQIDFAQGMLPFRYSEVVKLSGSGGGQNLLFAANKNGASYSELHMSAGERAILRLSREIAQLNNALVLIDEVEAGLHPMAQNLLMLHLQQLALRNDLQIIVTSHSPVVLDSVPRYARIFLERNEQGDITVCPPYRDIIQNALYGRSSEALNILCEDDAAEAILNGVVDVLSYEQIIRRDAVCTGRDTGAQEFPGHAAAFKKFGLIENFVFVLDGDQNRDNEKMAEKIKEAGGSQRIPVLFLPGDHAPECWVWKCLTTDMEESLAKRLGSDANSLRKMLSQLNALYDRASGTPSEIAKTKLRNLAENLSKEPAILCHIVAKHEAGKKDSDIQPLVEQLKQCVFDWRKD
ncbi:MAG: AAA family ATPase [Nitrospira sp.]|nr:AAA family ATPase [Nitrospira sp.]